MTLHDYLSKHEISDAEFARLIGVAQSTVLRWKRGQRYPTREYVERIHAATEGAVQPNDFLGAA